MRLAITFILFFCYFLSFAQQAKLKCYVSPKYSLIQLDGKKISHASIVDIDTGKHRLTVSYDKYLLFDTIINAQNDSLNRIYVRLKRDPVYLQYEKDIKHYRVSNTISIGIPLTILGAGLIGFKIVSSINNSNIVDQREIVLEAEEDYYKNINPNLIEDLKTDFYFQKDEYSQLISRKNSITISRIAFSSIAAGTSMYLIIKAIKRKKPTYSNGTSNLLISPYYNNSTVGLFFTKTF